MYCVHVKLSLYPLKYFWCERDTFKRSITPTFREKCSVSNEIMHHKGSKIMLNENGSERTSEKTTTHLHCLQGIKRTFLRLRELFWIVSSRTLLLLIATFNVLFCYLIFLGVQSYLRPTCRPLHFMPSKVSFDRFCSKLIITNYCQNVSSMKFRQCIK